MSDTPVTNVRLLDPASGSDEHCDLLVRDRRIADLGGGIGRSDGAAVIAGDDESLCPSLVDMRAALGELSYE